MGLQIGMRTRPHYNMQKSHGANTDGTTDRRAAGSTTAAHFVVDRHVLQQ